MTDHDFAVGDRVTWQSHGGQAEGRVVAVATADGEVSGFHFRATAAAPKYIVENDEGERAAHSAAALRHA